MHMTIFANGDISSSHKINLLPNTRVIAADGGASSCLLLGIIPQVVIGDFDSLTQDELRILESSSSTLIRYPISKDETDLELALNFAVEEGAAEIYLFGLLGGRWDMSFANIMLLTTERFKNTHFFIFNGDTELFILHGGKKIVFYGTPGDIVSAIPLSNQAKGISNSGLKWLLTEATLLTGSQRGVSNQIVENEVQISLKSGVLLVVHDRLEIGGGEKCKSFYTTNDLS
jgi:thiamine pyrophosphokinase